MPDNRQYTVLAAVGTIIGTHASIDATKVQVGYAAGLTGSTLTQTTTTQLPFVNIVYGGDATIGEFGPQNSSFIDWDIMVHIDIYVDAAATGNILEQDLLNLRRDIHEALMADITLGLSYVLMTYPVSAEEIDISAEARRGVAVQRTTWGIRLRHSYTNMDA